MCWIKRKKNYTIGEKKETLVVYRELPKKELKLNFNLIVPENYICYIFTKEKLTDSFCSGEVKLYALTMPSTCEVHKLDKPTKKGYKKNIKADLLFVSLKDFSLKNKFKIKKEKDKINLSYSLNYKIKDAKKFLEFLLNERAYFKNDYAEKQLNFYISYLLFYYYFDNDFDMGKFKKYIETKLLKIGIETLNFELERDFDGEPQKEIFNDYRQDERSVLKEIQTDNANSLLEETKQERGNETKLRKEENTIQNNIINVDKFEHELNGEPIKKSVEYFTCDCGAVLPKNAKFCFKCKKNFEDDDKILCENCGKEIGENVHVCPHCHSVLF